MKKILSIIALIVVAMAAQAQSYIDGMIVDFNQIDGHHVMMVEAADGLCHWQSIDRIAAEYRISIQSFERYYTVSECIAVGQYNRQVDALLARGIVARHLNCREYFGGMGVPIGGAYGYPIGGAYGYGSVGARVTIGGITIGGRATSTPYGTTVSGGVNSRAVSVGGSTILPRKAKATQPATTRSQPAQQVQSAPAQRVQVKTSTPDSGQVKEVTLEQYRNYVRRNQGK